MATISQASRMSRIEQVQEEEVIEIPIKKQVPKKQVLSERMICEVHSSPNKTEEIRYINLAFIAKNRPEFYRTFLCSVCFSEIKRKNPNDLGRIKSIRRFQEKYIESVFQKYSGDKPLQDTSDILEKAQTKLCSQIDSLNKRFNECCDVYKRNIKEMFQTLRTPLEMTQVRQFVEGKFNEGMIEQFYKNYQLVNKYQVLIGNDNQKVLEGVYKGFNEAMEKIQKDTEKELNQSLSTVKKYIFTCSLENQKKQKTERMVSEKEEKKEVRSTEERKTKNEKQQTDIRTNRKIQEPVRRRRMRVELSSDESSSSDSDDSSGSQNEKKAMRRDPRHQQRRRDQRQRSHKRHMIQRQNRAKPFRNENVYMIDEEFMKDSKLRRALYIVVKAHTHRTGCERVHRMDVEEFKKRYPQAFNRYLHLRGARK